jgi:futalosine hydrolase
MSKLLIVAATSEEILPLLNYYGAKDPGTEGAFPINKEQTIHVLIAGVGMTETAYEMGRHVNTTNDYKLIVNAGICGAFNRNLRLGEVVSVEEDFFSEMGAEDDTTFISFDDLGLGGASFQINSVWNEYDFLKPLKPVTAITVNKVHGNEESIAKTLAHFKVDVESMEGAAFFKGCRDAYADRIQLRSVSNYVEKRDKSKWNIPLAITNLNHVLFEIIRELKL